MSLTLSLMTAALTLVLISAAIFHAGAIARAHYTHPTDHIDNIAGFSPLFIGLALVFATRAGIAVNMMAYARGGDWDSPFVLHFPTATEFWLHFIPAHLGARSIAILADYGLALDLACLGFLGLALRSLMRGGKERGKTTWPQILFWVMVYALLYFVAIQTFLYLFAHLLGSVMLLGRFWFVPLILMALGAAGSTTKIYDGSGRHIGEIRRW